MNVLLTGGSGFLGRHLAARLIEDGHSAALLVSRRFRPERLAALEGRYRIFTAADEAARTFRPAVVFHLASTPFNPPGIPAAEHYRVILGGTLELLEALAGTGARFVFAGSGAEYGAGAGLGENAALEPRTMLGAAKTAASILTQTFARMSQVSTIVLRFFTPYGPWEHPHRLIPSVIRSGLRGEPVRLRGGGRQVRDYCFAGDAVEAMVLAARATSPPGAVVNVWSGQAVAVRDVAALTLALMGHPCAIDDRRPLPAREDEIWENTGSNPGARELLGWTPSTPLARGLEQTIAWFVENPQWLRLAN